MWDRGRWFHLTLEFNSLSTSDGYACLCVCMGGGLSLNYSLVLSLVVDSLMVLDFVSYSLSTLSY